MHHLRSRDLRLLALGLTAIGAPVGAQVLDPSQLVAAPYITTADVSNPNGVLSTAPAVSSGNPTAYNDPALGFNNARYWAKDAKYSGVTQLIMTYQTTNVATGATGTAGFICSGALINGGYSVLSAAHCFHNYTQTANGVTTAYKLLGVQVRLGQQFGGNTTAEPGAGAPSVNQGFNYVRDLGAGDVVINPGYTGSVIDQRDIAIINLGTPAPSMYQSYDLFDQSALGMTYNITGWGGRGNGNLGTFASGTAGARIRQGLNTWDATFTDPNWNPAFLAGFGLPAADIYLSDFDNGTTANNALCRLTGAVFQDVDGIVKPIWLGNAASRPCGTGLGLDEVSSAGGDSGGPSFVNGKIAGITSFGLTFGLGDIRSGLNSSFGEFNGMTRVDINADWVRSNTTTPEPTTIVLFGGGLLALAGVARRRRVS